MKYFGSIDVTRTSNLKILFTSQIQTYLFNMFGNVNHLPVVSFTFIKPLDSFLLKNGFVRIHDAGISGLFSRFS